MREGEKRPEVEIWERALERRLEVESGERGGEVGRKEGRGGKEG